MRAWYTGVIRGQRSGACALAALVSAMAARCDHAPVSAPRDAALVRAADATPVAQRRRRRRGNPSARRASADPTPARSNSASAGGTSAEARYEDLPGLDDDPSPPSRERPRITESGPMLPEDLGPPPSAQLDLTAGAASGPLGLEPAQVSRALDPLLGRLTTCAAATTDDQGHGPHGRVAVRLRVHPSGAPAAARVTGAGGPAAFVTCVRRVVASARFASFAGPDALVSWGFDVD